MEFNHILGMGGRGNETGFEHMLYIWNFWDYHVRQLSLPLPADLESLLQTLFRSENRHAVNRVRAGRYEGSASALGLYATFNLLHIYRLFHGLNTSTIGSEDIKEAIDNAASARSVSALRALLDLRGEGDRRDHDALYLSTKASQADSVQFMIDRGFDPNVARGEMGTALQAASFAIWGSWEGG